MKNEDKIKVTHIKQYHAPHPLLENKNTYSLRDVDLVAYSQFNVAKAILSHDLQNTIVLVEGYYDDLSQEDVPSSVKEAKMRFPDGLPDEYSDLTIDQKITLAKGGASLLLCLGKIVGIFKTCSEEESKEIEEKTLLRHRNLSQFHKDILGPREQSALKHAKQAAVKTGKSNVLIIYGQGHDFSKHTSLMEELGVSFSGVVDTSHYDTITNPNEVLLRLREEEKQASANAKDLEKTVAGKIRINLLKSSIGQREKEKLIDLVKTVLSEREILYPALSVDEIVNTVVKPQFGVSVK